MAKIIDRYTLAPLPLRLMSCGGIELSKATGFTYVYNEKTYLISNWHVFSGRNAQTGECLHSSGGCPKFVDFPYHIRGRLGDYSADERHDLYDTNGKALWLEHPVHGSKIDVAALRIEEPQVLQTGEKPDTAYGPLVPSPTILCTYPLPFAEERADMRYGVSQNVYVLGYPLSLTFQGNLPVWKKATIATEPEIDIDSLPKFLIDTATKEGMSGAPVIAREFHSYATTDGNFVVQPGDHSKFIGVYSGRYGAKEEMEAQLGIVWQKQVIKEIISGSTASSQTI